jgi:Ca2+-binding RTX toxin-like protein
MADYASIVGGNAPESVIGQVAGLDDVGRDWNALYFIESANVFLDRFDTTGNAVVDADSNPNAIRVELGAGTDTINTGAGADSIWAGAGNDSVSAGGGDDTVSGGAGDDLLRGGGGEDSLSGGEGDDTFFAGSGGDFVSGGGGDDSVLGEGGDDSLFGGSGADAMFGGEGDDTMVGGGGDDTMWGGAGNDTLFGGFGGDVFAFDDGFGQDVIHDFRAGDRIQLAADLNGTGISAPADLVANGMVTGGTTAAGTKFTVITVGNDTIRLEKVDSAEFINQINNWVQVG